MLPKSKVRAAEKSTVALKPMENHHIRTQNICGRKAKYVQPKSKVCSAEKQSMFCRNVRRDYIWHFLACFLADNSATPHAKNHVHALTLNITRQYVMNPALPPQAIRCFRETLNMQHTCSANFHATHTLTLIHVQSAMQPQHLLTMAWE